ncbi:MAG TPA: bifunctional diaminohydroxyphosphoribosylaminopyrimidine deaminase/5-amino-6-(5-phosphoribosylamino)uracil reductase RibD [Pyrinomonadaceae bacterium]|nr:bifunctional diaminohydroxyphosphoribosylaminopyrimidine deaminase/5-amino-6-(5-phosphoribosylamino)uracil reductase RibD [Pyrinomonadaceae bacterium]
MKLASVTDKEKANISAEADLKFLSRALELAEIGRGLVSPNPLVGCVIVNLENEIIGEAGYIRSGITHAEVLALEQAGDKARGATAYISLEPHDHFGRTPPCTEALIRFGIKRVVCPVEDPNPLVSGRGFEKLRSAGIEVSVGLLAEEAKKQNEKFFCWHEKRRPFLHLKMATSLDGKIAFENTVSTMLSGSEALARVHRLRHEYDAILVGSSTVAADDPNLTDRSGLERGRPLVRVILDSMLTLSGDSRIARTSKEIPTIVFASEAAPSERKHELEKCGIEVLRSPAGPYDLEWVLKQLRVREIQSVLVEGGGTVAASFLRSTLIDKVTFIYAPLIIGNRNAPLAIAVNEQKFNPFKLKNIEIERYGDDVEITGYPVYGDN